MRHKIYKLLFFLPSLFYYSLIFFLSSKSYQVNIEIFFFDKVIHFIEFGVLGFLLSLGFFTFSISSKKKFIFVFTIGTLLAVLDEIHQFFVPLRTLEILDLAADILGIGLGFFIFNYFYKKDKWLPF
ncbi:MAG: VanZ family protein [Candidatus Aminicenantes bacterium]